MDRSCKMAPAAPAYVSRPLPAKPSPGHAALRPAAARRRLSLTARCRGTAHRGRAILRPTDLIPLNKKESKEGSGRAARCSPHSRHPHPARSHTHSLTRDAPSLTAQPGPPPALLRGRKRTAPRTTAGRQPLPARPPTAPRRGSAPPCGPLRPGADCNTGAEAYSSPGGDDVQNFSVNNITRFRALACAHPPSHPLEAPLHSSIFPAAVRDGPTQCHALWPSSL